MVPAMDAPPAPLFRFDSPAGDDEAPSRRPAAWKAPVAMCAAALGGTAVLIAAVVPADAEAPAAGPTTFAPVAAEAGDGEPVVTALHVWDGRPVRATPQDTLPEDAAPAAAVWADAVAAAGSPVSPAVIPAPVRTASAAGVPAAGSRVAPAVWLTGEIRP